MDKNIVLIGFMGSGKTTYGKAIARVLGMEFIDSDEFIEETEGMDIISIFRQKGEEYFRELEKTAVESLSKRKGLVIATGGGTIKKEENMKALKSSGSIVYIEASAEKIMENLDGDISRPILDGGDKLEKITELLKERCPLYEKYKDITFTVGRGNIENNVKKLTKLLEVLV